MWAMFCFAAAALLAVNALIYQWRDKRPDYGGTMGGEMTTGLMWLASAVLGALGSADYAGWLMAVIIFVLIMAMSYAIRILISRLPK
jgi:hypothetical protein